MPLTSVYVRMCFTLLWTKVPEVMWSHQIPLYGLRRQLRNQRKYKGGYQLGGEHLNLATKWKNA